MSIVINKRQQDKTHGGFTEIKKKDLLLFKAKKTNSSVRVLFTREPERKICCAIDGISDINICNFLICRIT